MLDPMPLLAPAPAPPDPAATALAHAIVRRHQPGAELDRALALYVRRARAYDEPVERMLARLKALLHDCVRPLRADDDPHEVVALLMRRAITAYYRDD